MLDSLRVSTTAAFGRWAGATARGSLERVARNTTTPRIPTTRRINAVRLNERIVSAPSYRADVDGRVASEQLLDKFVR